jgi:DNA-binding Xre family transcriptional regulator
LSDDPSKLEILFDIDRDRAAGVYQLWLADECMYVGQTQNIFIRISEHWKRNFDRVVFIPVLHWSARLTLEEEFIRLLNPRWNVSLVSGRLSEDRRCKPHGARGRDLSGDRFANHRLLMNIAIEKAETQKKLAEIFGVAPQTVSHWRRTGDIPPDRQKQLERYIGLSVAVIATFIAENAGSDPWQKREYRRHDDDDDVEEAA